MATSGSANPHTSPNIRIESLARKRKISAVTFLSSLIFFDLKTFRFFLQHFRFSSFWNVVNYCRFIARFVWTTTIFCVIYRFWVKTILILNRFDFYFSQFQCHRNHFCLYVLDFSRENSHCLTKSECWTNASSFFFFSMGNFVQSNFLLVFSKHDFKLKIQAQSTSRVWTAGKLSSFFRFVNHYSFLFIFFRSFRIYNRDGHAFAMGLPTYEQSVYPLTGQSNRFVSKNWNRFFSFFQMFHRLMTKWLNSKLMFNRPFILVTHQLHRFIRYRYSLLKLNRFLSIRSKNNVDQNVLHLIHRINDDQIENKAMSIDLLSYLSHLNWTNYHIFLLLYFSAQFLFNINVVPSVLFHFCDLLFSVVLCTCQQWLEEPVINLK